MSTVCTIAEQFKDSFAKDPFEATAAIVWMHAMPPRFGHSRDLNQLINGSSKQRKDYLNGLLGASYAMFYIFIVWSVTILVLKCLGPKNVGAWSGSMQPLKAEPRAPQLLIVQRGDSKLDPPGVRATEDLSYDYYAHQYERRHEIWTKAKRTQTRNLNIMRVIVLFAGTSIVISATLMMGKGVSSLTETSDCGRNVIDYASNLIQQGIGLIDKFLDIKNQAETDMERLLTATNKFCPNIQIPLSCKDILNGRDCDLEGIPYESVVEEVIQEYVHGTSGLVVVFEEITNFRADLETMLDTATDMDKKAATFNWAFWCSAAYNLAVAVLSFAIMVGVLLAWYNELPRIFYYFRAIFIVPLFITLVQFSWIFSMVFVIGSMALADTCVDSPDGKILNVLNSLRGDISSIITDFLVYYISGCPADTPLPLDLLEQLNYARDSIPQLMKLVDHIALDINNKNKAGTTSIEDICGKAAPDLIFDAADAVTKILCRVADILQGVRVFFRCENLYPLYEGITYETVCYSGTQGFAWVASTQFVIVFMTMVIMTLRITFYEVEVEVLLLQEPEVEDKKVKEETSKNSGKEDTAAGSCSLELQSPSKEPDEETLVEEPYVDYVLLHNNKSQKRSRQDSEELL